MSRMKGSFVLMIVGFILSVFVTNVTGEDLIKFSDDNTGDLWFYDKDNVERSSGRVKVWVTHVYGKESKNNMVEIYHNFADPPKNLENLTSNKSLEEIDCKLARHRILTRTDYDKDGNGIFTINKPSKFRDIPPRSNIERLKNILCK